MVYLSPAMQDFILQFVVPTAGLVTGTFMTFAPYRAVLKASRDGSLGDLNATPWVFMLGNCAGWLAYSFLLKNVFVFLGNAPGFILAIWLNIQAIKLQYENYRSHELQELLIKALEEKSTSSGKDKQNGLLMKKNDVSLFVEQIMDDAPPIDILDPLTTTPLDDQLEDGNTTSHTKYNSLDGSSSNDADAAEQGTYRSSHHRRKSSFVPTAVLEATNRFIDYAGLVWEIAAQRSQAPASHELMVLAISTFWLILVTVVAFSQDILAGSTRILLVGVAVNINLIFFYGAPLSKIAVVLETKTSKLIHVPTMIFSLMNGALWFVYGLAVGDPFIAVPNGFGAVLGIVQGVLCLLYPRHYRSGQPGTDGLLKNSQSTGDLSSETGSLSLPEESTPLI